jgi:hypothetical protein
MKNPFIPQISTGGNIPTRGKSSISGKFPTRGKPSFGGKIPSRGKPSFSGKVPFVTQPMVVVTQPMARGKVSSLFVRNPQQT